MAMIAVRQLAPITAALEDLFLLAQYSLPGAWKGQVRYLPL
jgi:hypothetical protein